MHQLAIIIELLGTPSEDALSWLKGAPGYAAVKAMPPKKRVPWVAMYPKANPQALDLLDRLLTFDPSKRITVTEALAHPYVADYACADDEPVAKPPPGACRIARAPAASADARLAAPARSR